MHTAATTDDWAPLQARLTAEISQLRRVAVAFSGGVDSAVVAKAACLALGCRAVAVTGVSPSLPAGELEKAKTCADQIGIQHVVIKTAELEQSNYARNDGARCYWCKNEIYGRMMALKEQLGFNFILNGTNTDDLGDFRPGLAAADERGVISPLVRCGVDKSTVRALAKAWQLDVWDKPAGPCLASRIAPGVRVTAPRLRMIDQAEMFLRDLGFESVRVRVHQGELARIEVAAAHVGKLADERLRRQILDVLMKLGFQFATFDLAGFRTGSMNGLVNLNVE